MPMTSNLLENVQVYVLSQAVTHYCMIYFGNSSKIGIIFRINPVLEKSDVENLKNIFYLMDYYNIFQKKE